MALIDTGIRHNQRLKGHLYTFWRVNQIVDTYNAPAATGTNSQTCRKVTSWDLLTYYDPVGRVRLNVNGQFSNVLELLVDLAESGTHGLHNYLRLSVTCRLPGYSMDLPTGAVADSATAFHLDTEGQNFDVELAFTSYTYFNDVTLGYSERIEGAPTLTIGSLVVTFTRTAAPTASGDLQDTYHCSRRASVPGTGDSGVLTLPLTSQPQAFLPKDEFGPHGDNLDIGVWHYDITALPDELVRVDELAWEIDESGWPDSTPVLASRTFAFAAGSTAPDRVKEPATATCPTDLTFRTCAFTGGTERDATIGTVTSTLLKIEKNGDLSHQASWQLSDFFPITCWTECANPPGTLSPRHVACQIFDNAHFGSFLIEAPSQTLWQNFYRDGGIAQTSTNAQVIGPPPHYPFSADADGVDIAEAANGMRFRTYRDGGDIWVDRLRPGQTTWDAAVQLNPLSGSDAAADSAPTITIDRFDTVFVWYHTSAPRANGYYSTDYGVTWSLYATPAAYLFPRLAFQQDRALWAAFSSDTLEVYVSDYNNAGETITTAVSFGVLPKKPFVLRVDRYDVAHLVYEENDGSISHRHSKDVMRIGSWANAVTLVAVGEIPGYGIGIHEAFLTWFDASHALQAARLDETYGVVAAALPAGLPFDPPTQPGLLVDRYGVAVIAGRNDLGPPLEVQFSKDDGENWEVL